MFLQSSRMKQYLLITALFVTGFACKKKVDEVKMDLVVQAMTDGRWKMTSFSRNGVDISADFTNYRFKYYSNKTVDAINNGTVEKTGTWDGDANSMSTSANFNSAVYPLQLINGSWHIDNNSWTFVVATQTVGTETKTMRLDKE